MAHMLRQAPMVKKTVVLHPIMDAYVRKTWAILIEDGLDATYSSAVNFMLLAAIKEAEKENGLSQDVRDLVWEFASDPETMDRLNLEDQLLNVRNLWGKYR
jgi:hypothetical protein